MEVLARWDMPAGQLNRLPMTFGRPLRGILVQRQTQLSCIVPGEIARSVLAFGLEPADMLLGVEFEPDPLDQVKLGFEEVDMMLLVRHQ